MSDRHGASIQQFRDQILALLREVADPLSTRDVADHLLGPVPQRISLPAGFGAEVGDMLNGRPIVKCDGIDLFGNAVYIVDAPAPCSGVYRHLRALEKAGMVVRLDGDGADRTVYWAFLGQIGVDDERYAAQLEALWELPPVPEPQPGCDRTALKSGDPKGRQR